MDKEIINTYNRECLKLVDQYESKTFEEVHADVLRHLPVTQGNVLDVGAGSGRDAAWFAAHGYQVVAVEPAEELRAKAQARHHSHSIRWLSDSLPALESTLSLNLSFDLIWISAVWMHLPPKDRERAFRKLSSLLKPNGKIMISLRHGPAPPNRKMYPVSADELLRFARERGLHEVLVQKTEDSYQREDVWWQTVILQLPDNGTAALPILRHITLNDGKASTYKLALLRCLVRIADSATGLARYEDPDYVTIPLGLVALYWVRQYKQLLDMGLPQTPENKSGKGLGFVKDGFNALSLDPKLLKPGTSVHREQAQALRLALGDAAKTIKNMPAHYITYAGSEDQIFKATYGKLPSKGEFSISPEVLWSYGNLKVPITIWHAMSQYAVWIEPALIKEWMDLIRSYQKSSPSSYDELMNSLQWLDPDHDTQQVRKRINQLQKHGHVIRCVWGNTKLQDKYEVDHCFPFAHWPCNDLWNLMPSSKVQNGSKKDKLPSASRLHDSKSRIISWWKKAYLSEPVLCIQFYLEASATLPCIDIGSSLEDLFEAMLVQQHRIASSQHLNQW